MNPLSFKRPAAGDVERCVGMLFGDSDPDQKHHHLVLGTLNGETNALGMPKLSLTIMAIAYVQTEQLTASEFIANTIRAGAMDALKRKELPYLAALTLQMNTAFMPTLTPDCLDDYGLLPEDAVNLDGNRANVDKQALYAASADGRRWWGEHILSGPDASGPEGPFELTGPPLPQDRSPFADIIRGVVGATLPGEKRRASFGRRGR